MYYQCRLRLNANSLSINESEPVLVNLSVTANHRIVSFRNIHITPLAACIQHNYNVSPIVTPGIILQTKSHQCILRRQKLKMPAHKTPTAKTESRMITAQGDKIGRAHV